MKNFVEAKTAFKTFKILLIKEAFSKMFVLIKKKWVKTNLQTWQVFYGVKMNWRGGENKCSHVLIKVNDLS